MDLPSLTSRLESLALTPFTSTGPATILQTFFFTPKSGSKQPDFAEVDLKLVVVAIEDTKNVGAAKAVAAGVGLKDMRAIGAADLVKLIGRSKEDG